MYLVKETRKTRSKDTILDLSEGEQEKKIEDSVSSGNDEGDSED